MLKLNNLKSGLIVILLLLALLQIAVRVQSVIQQIEELSTAQSDNVQWTLSQTEVDYRQLRGAIYGALSDQRTPSDLRKRFDIFFSRVNSVQESDAYAMYRDKGVFSAHLNKVADYLNRALPIVDGDDANLMTGLPTLLQDTNQIEQSVRWLALSGLSISAAQSDMLRSDMRRLVTQLVVATLVLILGLVALVLVLRVLNRQLRSAIVSNRQSKARLEAMVETSLDGILVFDQNCNILEHNEAATEIFGASLSRTAHPSMTDLVYGARGDEFETPAESGLVGRGRVQTSGRRMCGRIFPVEIAITQTKLQNRDDVYVAYVRDISDRQNAEAALLKARDNAQAGEKAKANLLAVMSHEIRTPLNGMLGAAELLQTTDLTKKQRDLLNAMDTSGNVLLRHVNDILDISRLDAEPNIRAGSAFNLHDLATELIQSQHANAARFENVIELTIADGVSQFAFGQPRKIQQALLNLIGNAIKFTKRGKITVELDHFGQGDLIEFRVIDTGIGIAETELDRIFDDFFAIDTTYGRQQQGTGLGLSITRRLVSSMNGEIGAESLVNEGSLFWFRIPLPAVEKSTEAEGVHQAEVAKPKQLSVLLVEDNEINRMITRDMLINAGHKVTEANDGGSSVIQAEMNTFDVILMDISMPGMDGLTATAKIRASEGRSSRAPIVALTAQVLESDIAQIQAAGIHEILTKPISAKALANALADIVSSPAHLRSPAPDTTASKPTDSVLREDVLNDVLSNIGLASARRHHAQLHAQMRPLLQKLDAAASAKDAPMKDVHALCGATAVLGLCTLHRHLGDIETLPPDTKGAEWQSWVNRADTLWEMSEAALLVFLAQWDTTENPTSIEPENQTKSA